MHLSTSIDNLRRSNRAADNRSPQIACAFLILGTGIFPGHTRMIFAIADIKISKAILLFLRVAHHAIHRDLFSGREYSQFSGRCTNTLNAQTIFTKENTLTAKECVVAIRTLCTP